MKVFRGLPNQAARAPCALAIGNFDGVHRGHQMLLTQVRAAALRLNIDAAVMTFEPHPREFFARQRKLPDLAPARIANLRDKLQSLADLNIDRVVVEHFNIHFAALSAQEFIERVLVSRLNVRWMMVGEDFRFGKARAGDISTLKAAGQELNFRVQTQPTVFHGGLRVSSSAIRAALLAADFEQARTLLGHPYRISGHVVHGLKLGRKLGFPTLNLRIAHTHPALTGIFVVQVRGLGDEPRQAVASLGARPTVDDSGQYLLEAHVLDFNESCYGKVVQIEFLKKLRNEEKFADMSALTKAISRDTDATRHFFSQYPIHT